MKIESPVFGSFEVADEKLIDFPAGLPGLEHCKRFTLVHQEGGTGGLWQLQSVDDPAVVLSVAGPESLGVNYEFTLDDQEVALLRLTSPADAAVAVIVRKEQGGPADTGLRANFMGPLVINAAERIGMQKIIARLGCDITLRAEG